MITVKKARDLALGELNWWERWRKESNEHKAIYNCSEHWFESLAREIEIAAKGKRFEYTADLLPNFYSTTLAGGSPSLHWFDYTEQINIAQEAIERLKRKIESKGFRVSFKTIKMSEAEINDLKSRYFNSIGKVDIKFEITVDWKLI